MKAGGNEVVRGGRVRRLRGRRKIKDARKLADFLEKLAQDNASESEAAKFMAGASTLREMIGEEHEPNRAVEGTQREMLVLSEAFRALADAAAHVANVLANQES